LNHDTRVSRGHAMVFPEAHGPLARLAATHSGSTPTPARVVFVAVDPVGIVE
jgi:hypothetical protein